MSEYVKVRREVLEEILRRVEKGITPEEQVEAGRKAIEAGGLSTSGRPVSAADYDNFLPKFLRR